jgi:hypothetical protein
VRQQNVPPHEIIVVVDHNPALLAQVAKMVGTAASLSAERAYTLHTLPHGLELGVWDTLRHGDRSGVARAAVIVIGLLVMVAGIASGSSSRRCPLAARPENLIAPLPERPSSLPFSPARLVPLQFPVGKILLTHRQTSI